MKRSITLFLLGALAVKSLTTVASENANTYVFDKGQVIDFLFLTRKPDSDKALKQYFKEAIPIATKLGYKPLYYFPIKRKPIRGNQFPNGIAIGGWPGDFDDRQAALTKLGKAIPDLHSRRMEIWSTFNMTNYLIEKPKSFILDTKKIYVLTAYWQQPRANFADYKATVNRQKIAAGAKKVLEFDNGRSPFGYRYNPDYTVLIEWGSQAAFDTFRAEQGELPQDILAHVNQYYIEPPAKK